MRAARSLLPAFSDDLIARDTMYVQEHECFKNPVRDHKGLAYSE